MKKYTLILLILFFLSALFVRVYKLGVTPQSLTWDEAALGYNTYSILLTGKDEYGTKLPLVLRSYDDYKPALYAYLSLPFIQVFGLTITAIRLLSAIAGASLVFSVYLLAKNILEDERTALIASALVVVSPLMLLYSRIALEANLSLSLFILGAALILKKEFSRLSYSLGLFFLLLSAYAYHSPRYIVPFLVLFTFILPFKTSLIKEKLKYLAPFSILFLPVVYFVLSKQYNARFEQTSLITNIGILFASNVQLTGTPLVLQVLSRLYFYFMDFGGRFLTYFNPYQLFIHASGHELYHLDGWGVFNPIELPFWLVGIYQLLKKPMRYWPIWMIWILAPLPAAITVDWFSSLRAILLWPFLFLVTAKGINHILNLSFKYKTLILIGTLALWLFNAGRIKESILAHQPYAHYGAYQYGFAQTIPFVNSIQDKYSQIIIESPHAQPHMFVLFFSKYPPDQYQQDTAWRKDDYSDRHNFDFGPYTFRRIYWPDDRNLKNTLFVGNLFALPTDQINSTPEVELVKDFLTPDGNISFRVVTTKP